MYACEHTRLMNMFIGLCKDSDKWPSILYEQGYRISLIEQRVGTESTSVTPDVVVTSNKLSHSIVADCKGGQNIDLEQDGRYRAIKAEHLFMWIHVREKKRFKSSACYVTKDAHYGRLQQHTTLPFVVFAESGVKGEGDFGLESLNKVLCRGASRTSMVEPTSHYPFSHEDDSSLIVKYVIQGVLFWLNRNRPESLGRLIDDKVACTILKTIHPHYRHMGERHQNALLLKVKNMIASLVSHKEFRMIKDKRLDGQLAPPVLQRFTEHCQAIVKDWKVQARLDQRE